MSPCRITKLEICGFRAFGRNAQTLEFPSLLATIWGPNSQGKTSLAEAVEFLLTGQIVRRALMASGQDEFAGALRNAHLPAAAKAYIKATILAGGMPHTIKRTVKTDYGKKQDCETILEIDGKPAAETDLAALSQPPLCAPVLAQHTLGYLFSAKPQDRATYFKALLEVTDLEQFRNAVAALEYQITGPPSPHLDKFALAKAVPLAGKHFMAVHPAKLDPAFGAACKELIDAHGEPCPAKTGERLGKLESILAEKRAKTFAQKGFDRKPAADWSAPAQAQYAKLSACVEERAKVDEEVRRMTGLFREALALPAVARAKAAADCPLCETEGALTPERIAFIRSRVADTEGFQAALTQAQEALRSMAASLEAAAETIKQALPLFIANPSRFRRERGFRIERIAAMLGAGAASDIAAWLQGLRRLVRKRNKAVAAIRGLWHATQEYTAKPDTLTDAATLKSGFERVAAAYRGFKAELAAYDPLEKKISASLKVVVDAESKTAGWQELIELGRDQPGLRDALIDRSAREQAGRDLAKALKQIDDANEAVLDEKFEKLSDGVQHWWDLLRPEESSFFTGVIPRPGARRTIDFKAGLSANEDRSDPKLRDVIAVFSQSQLHCLGLALFLARAVREGAGFVVLDDPILSSDEDYRAFFNAMVIEDLLKRGLQVIVLTQDQKTFKDLGDRYLHEKISQFQIVLQSPADGSEITNTADDLETRFIQAKTLIRGGHVSLRKRGGEIIRDAAERFCKEVLVRDHRAKGNRTASLIDYDGKNLGELTPLVEPLLTKDPSHPGKLRTIGADTNPAKHDDDVPARGVLTVALGNLRDLKKIYLA
jgi:hypothetical protein